MEASVSQDGIQATEQAAPEGTQAAPPQPQTAQLPPEVTQRLDEINGRFDHIEPLLQNFQEPEYEEEDPYGDNPYAHDQDLQGLIAQEAQRIAESQVGPLQQRVEAQEQYRTQEQFEDLKFQYPQLQDEAFQQRFVPQVQQAAARYAQALGQDESYAAKLATNPQFVADQYLAGLAREQAQQGVPAGDQGVHIEGGTGTPGQPSPDAKQEWLGGMQLGSQSGPFGRSLDEL